MGNLVPSSGSGNALAQYGGVNPWAEAARGVESGAYLKFNGNEGRYSFGQDDDELPVGSRVVAEMESLGLGWICWVDSSVEEEIIKLVIDGKAPMEHELPDHGPYNEDDGWRSAASISLVLESYGDDDQDEAVGSPLLWKTSTSGQVRSLQKLSGAYGRAFAQHPGKFPIVELGAESYAPKNKKHGKLKWSPSLKIVGWMSAAELAGLTGDQGDDEGDYEEPAPRASKRQPEPEPEDEPAPRRGGGRRAPEPEAEEEEAPAPRRGRRAPEPEAEDEQAEAPAPRRGRRAPEPEPEDEQEEEAPAPRRGRRAPEPEAEEEDEDAAPAPRGRSSGRRAPAAEPAAEDEQEEEPAPRRGRSAPPANARMRRFD